jgi:hypothetical protein
MPELGALQTSRASELEHGLCTKAGHLARRRYQVARNLHRLTAAIALSSDGMHITPSVAASFRTPAPPAHN